MSKYDGNQAVVRYIFDASMPHSRSAKNAEIRIRGSCALRGCSMQTHPECEFRLMRLAGMGDYYGLGCAVVNI